VPLFVELLRKADGTKEKRTAVLPQVRTSFDLVPFHSLFVNALSALMISLGIKLPASLETSESFWTLRSPFVS
jgi:hypothetical protein